MYNRQLLTSEFDSQVHGDVGFGVAQLNARDRRVKCRPAGVAGQGEAGRQAGARLGAARGAAGAGPQGQASGLGAPGRGVARQPRLGVPDPAAVAGRGADHVQRTNGWTPRLRAHRFGPRAGEDECRLATLAGRRRKPRKSRRETTLIRRDELEIVIPVQLLEERHDLPAYVAVAIVNDGVSSRRDAAVRHRTRGAGCC